MFCSPSLGGSDVSFNAAETDSGDFPAASEVFKGVFNTHGQTQLDSFIGCCCCCCKSSIATPTDDYSGHACMHTAAH